jgi:hypothetical protein
MRYMMNVLIYSSTNVLLRRVKLLLLSTGQSTVCVVPGQAKHRCWFNYDSIYEPHHTIRIGSHRLACF